MDESNQYQALFDWMQSIVMVFLCVVFVLLFVGRRMTVDGYSMEPTLADNDQMIVRSILYEPDYGDIVVIAKQDFKDGTPFVKRVIALEGDVVDIDTAAGVVYVNGEALDEPYTSEPTYTGRDMTYPYTVPEGYIFVMGDNRNISVDSRSYDIGPVDPQEIIGKVEAVIFPFSHLQRIG